MSLNKHLAEKAAVVNRAAQTSNGNNNAPAKKAPSTIFDYINLMKPEITKALPATKGLDADRLARIITTEIRKTPKLLNCSRESLLGALMLSAQLGLEPGPLGLCYFIPYGQECQFIIGYRGMIDLARRSGNIESIDAQVVYENDEFNFEYGLNPNLTHKPTLGTPGKAIAYYAVAKFKDGGYQMRVMSKDQVEAIKKRSKSGNNGPWKTDYDEMAKKSVIRAIFKYLPISVELMQMAQKDEAVKTEIAADAGENFDFIETTATETGAIEPPQQSALSRVSEDCRLAMQEINMNESELDKLFEEFKGDTVAVEEQVFKKADMFGESK